MSHPTRLISACLLAALAAGCAAPVPQAASVPAEAPQSERELLATDSWTSSSNLSAPSGIAFAPDGSMWVSDEFEFYRFDASGQRSLASGFLENRGARSGLAVGKDGIAYVIDAKQFRILKVSPEGKVLKKWGKYGTGDDQFVQPFDVTVDEDGYVYVSDVANGRVQKFDANGKFVRKWSVGGKGGLTIVPGFGVVVALGSSVHAYGFDGRHISRNVLPVKGTTRSDLSWIATIPNAKGRPQDLVMIPGDSDLMAVNPLNGRVAGYIATGHDLTYMGGLAIHKEQAYVTFWKESEIRRFALDTAFRIKPLFDKIAAPRGIAYNASGHLFVVGLDQQAVLRAQLDGKATPAPVAEYASGRPTGLSLRPDGTLLVADSAGRQVRLIRSDGTETSVPLARSIAPTDVVDDGNGGFVVADAGETRLLRFDANGQLIGVIGGGSFQPNFFMANGVAKDRQGHYWVADTGNHRVMHVTPSGGSYQFKEWGGQFNLPTDVLVDDARQSVYVVDRGNHRIMELDRSGKLKGILGSRSSGLNSPYAAALGPDGSLFVSDAGNNRVVKIERGIQ